MGLLDTFTATAQQRKKKFKIDRKCQELLIVRHTNNKALNGKILTNAAEVLTIENDTTDNRRQSIADRIPLGYLAGFAQFGEGVIPEVQINQDVQTCFSVVLGRDGFDITSSDTATVVIEDMIVGATYDVYAMEVPVTGSRYWQYMKGSILEGDHNKGIDLDAATAIMLPSTAGISRATVTFATTQGDKTCDYTLFQLQYQNAKANDVESLLSYRNTVDEQTEANTFTFGSMTSELLVIMLGPIKHIDFHTDGSLIEYVTVTERSRHAL